ncbi:MAG: glycosyltransferase [Candidatus Moraniibacteriota bacterium]|nr:MAG: glycosyltransferase [Candidatus Moranbacteria bacterium]
MLRERISVLVPTLNEEGNVADLVRRVDVSFRAADIEYEVIFIDDHSTDGTRTEVEKLSKTYPVFFHLKKGNRGKAYSILEGFDYAHFETIAMIDADLQYPPEALPDMCAKLHHGFDIVVANRIERETSLLRRVLSRGFALVFSRFLHGLDVDVQSGMKVFRARVAHEVKITPDPWTFDLEFLLTARNYGYEIGGQTIAFAERTSGESKIVFWKAIREIGWNAVKLRFRERAPLRIHPETVGAGKVQGMLGAGVAHNRKRFVTHSTLAHHSSALHTFVSWQKIVVISIALAFVVGVLLRPISTLIAVTAILTSIYFLDVLFNAFFVVRSLKKPPEVSFSDEELATLRDEQLPLYSILCPLYREAHILPGFLDAIGKIDWPKEKLEALLLLEENDQETIDAATEMNLPSFVRIVVVPHSEPKTKPKACNYGLSMTRGEYVVIYDAEDIPDPLQLKKAYLGFQTLSRDVWCLQAKLNYFNANQNILTRLFTAEYSLWFDVTLPGLQSVATSIPLGGTSNHFRREDLLALEGWDPFNVTEDCDLGARIFTRGHRTAIIDSVTLEEANSKVGNWIRQRSRWIKGYMQTYLVHMRQPGKFFRDNGIHALLFQFVVGGKIAFMLINPLLWLQTILYFAFRPVVGPAIEALYPPVVFYMAVVSLIFGNFLAMYYYMIGCAKREKWELMKWVFLIPFYWLLVSVAAVMAAYQLLVKPHYWEKTTHGLHLLKRKKKTLDGASEKKVEKVLGPSIRVSPENFFATSLQRGTRGVLRYFSNTFSWISGQSRSIGALLRKFSSREYTRPILDFAFSAEGLFVIATFLSNVLNFAFNAFLGRMLSFETLGMIALLNTLWYLALVFISPFSTTINREVSYLSARNGEKEALVFWASIMRIGLIASVFVTALWLFAVPALSRFFHVGDVLLLFSFAPLLAGGLLAFGNFGYLQGALRFRAAAILSLVEAGSKLIIALGFVFSGLHEYVYLSIPVSVILAAFSSFFLIPGAGKSLLNAPQSRTFPLEFFSAAILVTVSTAMFTTVDVLLAKHFMSERGAGEYALLSLVGKVIFFLGTMPNMFMVTFVGRNRGLGKGTKNIFWIIYGLSACVVAGSVVLLGFFDGALSMFLFGGKVSAVLQFLPMYTIAIAFFTLSTIIVTYHLARKQYIFVFAALLMSGAEAIGIILFHSSLDHIVDSVFLSSLCGWILLSALHIAEPSFRFFERAVRDFLDAFRGRFPEETAPLQGKRVLIFNWRDTKHAYGGGAEVYVEEIAKRWVADGNSVTMFCGNDGHQSRHETRHGIRIVRRGGFYLVYVWAVIYYFARFRGKFDVIIDCENGIPFFTPLYVKEPVVCLLHHVHQEVFFQFLPKPLAFLASFLEKTMMPLVYSKAPFVTVSQSSQHEMELLGIGKAGISVVHPGVHLDDFVPVEQKSDRPTLLYLGRLKAYKSVGVLLHAFKMVVAERPESKLIIAGDGDDEMNLKRLAFETLRLGTDHVEFLGRVSEEEKKKLLQESWMLVNPSMMEGWGIVAIEANACGTPVIASNVPGLRDSVKNPHSGFLVPYGDADAFAEKILLLIRDRELRLNMNISAREWAERFDWNLSSAQLLEVVSVRDENRPL